MKWWSFHQHEDKQTSGHDLLYLVTEQFRQISIQGKVEKFAVMMRSGHYTDIGRYFKSRRPV